MITLTHPEHGTRDFYDSNGYRECIENGWTVQTEKPVVKRAKRVKKDVNKQSDNNSVTA